MLARMRRWLLLSCSLVVLLAAFLPVQAQIHGVAPSVTSFGFGGSNNPTPGIPASVTSLGPNGFGNSPLFFHDCCFGPNFFSNHPPLFRDRRVHDRDHHRFPTGLSMPVYVPYVVPYPVPYADAGEGEDDSADEDSSYSRGVPVVNDRGGLGYRDARALRQGPSDPAPRVSAPLVAPDAPEPVAAQPATVLVFKDGHKSEVQNYAIAGDTLFDYSDGRSHRVRLADLDLPATQKANEDRGVDFQIPASAAKK